MKPGEEFDFNGTKAKYPDVKMIYWVGGNPFVHHQQRNRMLEAWHKVETFVVHDFAVDADGAGTPISCCRRPQPMSGTIWMRSVTIPRAISWR